MGDAAEQTVRTSPVPALLVRATDTPAGAANGETAAWAGRCKEADENRRLPSILALASLLGADMVVNATTVHGAIAGNGLDLDADQGAGRRRRRSSGLPHRIGGLDEDPAGS